MLLNKLYNILYDYYYLLIFVCLAAVKKEISYEKVRNFRISRKIRKLMDMREELTG